jgi:inhibitor of KinA sporulation pathway (predicted exonuclease)
MVSHTTTAILETALELMGMEFEGVQHGSLPDARTQLV